MKIDNLTQLNMNINPKDYIDKPNIPISREEQQALTKNGTSNQEENVHQVSERSVIDAIEKANKVTISHNTRAEFSVHEITKDIMIKIVDTETNDVIREFPPKKFLDLIAKLWDLAGIVVDERR